MLDNISEFLDWKAGKIRLSTEYNISDVGADAPLVEPIHFTINSLKLIDREKRKLFKAHISSTKKLLLKSIAPLLKNNQHTQKNLNNILATIKQFLSADKAVFQQAFSVSYVKNAPKYTLKHFNLNFEENSKEITHQFFQYYEDINYPNSPNKKVIYSKSLYSMMPAKIRLEKMLAYNNFFIHECLKRAFILLLRELRDKLKKEFERSSKKMLKNKKPRTIPLHRIAYKNLNTKQRVGISFANGEIYKLLEDKKKHYAKDIAAAIKIPGGVRFINATLTERADTNNIYYGEFPEFIARWMINNNKNIHPTYLATLQRLSAKYK